MGSESVSTVSKPEMRGLLHATIKKNLILALVFAGMGAVAMRVFYGDARKKKYADFYKNYNPEEAFERMRKAGVMTAASP